LDPHGGRTAESDLDDRDRTLRRLAVVVFVVLLAAYLGCIVWALLDPDVAGASVLDTVVLPTVMFSFAIAGLLVAGRRPRNPIAWILFGIGGAWVLSGLTEEYARVALSGGALPAGAAVMAFSLSTWVLAIAPMGTFLLLLFPDGQLPSRRWRWLAWLSGFSVVFVFTVVLMTPGSLVDAGYPHVQNPLTIPSLAGVIDPLEISALLIPICIVASAVALVMRFRRSVAVERLQLKWLTSAAAAVALTYAVAMIVTAGVGWGSPDEPEWASAIQLVALASFALIPAGIAVAILRYRLYDIDRIISRAISYAALTAVLAAVYAAIVVGIGALLGGANDPWLIAGATLAVAALFGPARRRIQAFLDRRFFRRRYDLDRTLASFTSRLRDEVDLEQVRDHLVATVHQTLAPSAASVWMRGAPPEAPVRPAS
jgi:MFS family permease